MKKIIYFISIIIFTLFSCSKEEKKVENSQIPTPVPVTTNVSDIDGNVYNTVVIGTQTWLNKNLNVSRYRNGDVIPQVTDPAVWQSLSTGAWCYLNNDPANGVIYGKLYNWYAVNDPRGLAPVGYHIPNDSEWTTITNYLGGDSIAGGKMKNTGTQYWISPNTGATNESGFSGLPGGLRGLSGYFNYYVGENGLWWSSTEDGILYAYNRSLNCNDSNIGRYFDSKESGFSVRCIKN